MPHYGVARSVRLALLLCIVGLTSTAPVWAQSTFGTVLGTVTDASGALIAKASVVVTNVDENTARSVDTDARGDYQAVNMKPGRYRIEVVAQGFEPFTATELILAARQTLRVDAALNVGKVSETVSVSSAGAIATDTQTISSAIGAERILSLPANYRATGSTSPYVLIGTLPGVQSDNDNNFTVQGALPSQTQYSVDGISITNVGGNGPIRDAFPSAESLAEIKVQGVGNAAEYALVGDITTISKSGTNQLHGSGFWFHNDEGLDAKQFGALTKTKRTGNDYGGSVGGPLSIPGLYSGTSKSFFFLTYERFKFPKETTVQNTVPTAAMRGGDLSLEGVTVKDPQTGQPFPGNRIPASRISPIARQVLDLYPMPNAGDTGTQHSANYVANYDSSLISNQYDLRLDHYLTAAQSMFGRYTSKKVSTNVPKGLVFPSSTQDDAFRSFVLSHNYTITPSLLNEARVGFSYHENARDNTFKGREFTNGLGLVGIGPTFPFNGVPEFNFDGDTTSVGLDRADAQESQKTIQFADNVTWSAGKHTFKFGFDWRQMRATSPLGFTGADNYGNFDFTGAFTGSDFGDFLLGIPEATSYAIVSQDNDGSASHYAFFAQDNYQIGKNLTLEYGLRWEYHPAYEDASGNIGNFDPSVPRTGQVVYPTGKEGLISQGYLATFTACPAPPANGTACTPVLSADQAGLPESLRKVGKRIMPRVGFAYRPFSDDKTVVRGGIGGYNGSILGNVFYSLTGTLQSDVRTFTNLDAQGNPIFAWPNVKTGGTGISVDDIGTAYFGTANDIDWKDPYSTQWNLSVDRYIGGNIGLRLSYIGMHTTQLVWAPDLNQMTNATQFAILRPLTDRPFPNWGTINTRSIGASAKYNALQMELNRRYSRGLAFTTTYTLAKNLADNGGPTSSSIPGENAGGRAADRYNRQAEFGNDYATRRHRSISTVAYDLPFGQGQHFLSSSSGLVNGIVGGWQLSGILLMQSGPHLTPYYNGIDPSGSGSGVIAGRPQHPDRIADGSLDNPTVDKWFDTSAFVCPGATAPGPCHIGVNPATDLAPIGRFGNAGVGILTGPGTFNLSLGLLKTVAVSNGVRVEAGIAFTNVLNHTNLADPNLNVGSADFGKITSARSSDLGGNRTGQVNLRVRF
jgi:hypothetical protein